MRGAIGTAAALLALAVPAPAMAGERDEGAGAFAPLPRATWSAAQWLLPPVPDAMEAAEHHDLLDASPKREFTVAPPDLAAHLGKGPDGGPGVAHHAGARPVSDPPFAVPSGIQRSIGQSTFEPSLGITSDGSIFYIAIDESGAVPGAIILRSSDEGATWKRLQRGDPNGETPTEDPLIYVDPRTNRLFDFELTLPCSFIYFSDDLGKTFSNGLACNHADHQTLFAGPAPKGGAEPSGYPNVVYYCAIDGGASAAGGVTGCSKSLDGGVIWQRTLTPPYVSDGSRGGGSLGIPGFCYGATGHGRVGPDGTVYLPRGFCNQPFLAISHDEGDTWKLVQVSDKGINVGTSAGVGIEEHEARVAIDPAGNVYYFWIARDHLPYLTVSRDGGEHFAKPMMVAPPGVNEAWGPALDAGDTGRVAFSYLATTNSPGGPFCATTTPTSCRTADGSEGKPESAYAHTTWSGYIGETVDALAADPVFYTAPVNDPRDPLTRGVCGSVQCEPTHEFHGVSIAPDGTPWASFADGCDADEADGCGGSIGIVGRLVGGPPLHGTLAEQRPQVTAPPSTPPAPACTPRRRLTVVLRDPRRAHIRSVRATLGGRAVRVRRHGRRRVATLDLGRYAAGRTVTLRLTIRTSAGRRYVTVRRYRLCS
jgi:hypothetical protein